MNNPVQLMHTSETEYLAIEVANWLNYINPNTGFITDQALVKRVAGKNKEYNVYGTVKYEDELAIIRSQVSAFMSGYNALIRLQEAIKNK